MYEELYAPLPDVGAYLARIGLPADRRPEPTAEWLDKLVHAQLVHIPFDAMDVWGRSDCPSLAIEDLFQKIIVRRRGGYCFELNSLFCAFLKALGYDAYLVVVRLVGGRDFVPPPAHCAVVCVIDGEKYFSDVGYGGPVPDGCVRFGGAVAHGYRIGSCGSFTTLELTEGEQAGRVMLFHDVPAEPVDMIPLNFHVSQRPDSFFQMMLNLNLRLEDGSVSIFKRSFHLHTASEEIRRDVRDLDDLRELLPRYFGIPADDPPLRELD